MTTPQDQFAEASRRAQEAVLASARTWADNVQRLSTASTQAGQVPSVNEVIDNVFGFAEQMLAAQRDFTKNLLEALAPAVEQAGDTAAGTARDSGAKNKR